MPNTHAVPEAVSASVAKGANLVRAMREFVGYSVEDLAVASGLATEEIDRVEAGDDADPARLRRIAHALGLPEEALAPYR